MNKTLRILLYIITLLFIYLGISMLYKGCNTNNSDSEFVIDGDKKEYDIFEDAEEDDFFAEDGTTDATAKEETTSTSSPKIDYTAIDEAVEESPKEVPAQKPATTMKKTPEKSQPVTTISTNQTSTGNYMVIAGSYLVKANAETMVSKLNTMGYNGAELVVFDERKYNTVCAGRYNTFNDAQRQVNALKRKGIDSYVHTRQ